MISENRIYRVFLRIEDRSIDYVSTSSVDWNASDFSPEIRCFVDLAIFLQIDVVLGSRLIKTKRNKRNSAGQRFCQHCTYIRIVIDPEASVVDPLPLRTNSRMIYAASAKLGWSPQDNMAPRIVEYRGLETLYIVTSYPCHCYAPSPACDLTQIAPDFFELEGSPAFGAA